jgi:hypothetical protein
MRYFPRGAFKDAPENPVQTPVAPVQCQQFQQMQQYQQQMWQQSGMPMTAPQASAADPMFLYRLRMLAHQQAHPMHMVFQGSPLQVHPLLSSPAWYLMGLGGFGYPGY